jgi:anti-sigma-K factor RskA
VTHAEFLDQVDAYALGALEPEEARALAAHLRDEGPHPECEAALERAQSVVTTLVSDLTPIEPPARVWKAIERTIAPRASLRAPAWGWGLAAAAAALLLVVGGVTVRGVRRNAEQAQALAAQCARDLAEARVDLLRKEDALKLLVEPGTQLVSLRPSAGAQGSAVVLYHPRGRALFVSQRLPAEPTRDYELWLIRDGRPVAAGLLPQPPEGQVLVDIRPEVLAGGRPSAFAVSLEQKGGEQTAPRGAIVLQGALGAP